MINKKIIYGNIKFNSLIEAKWAVFFDTLNLKWEYHKQEFKFSHGKSITPDFYIEGIGWFEVRTKTSDHEIYTLCRGLAVRTQEFVFIANGDVPATEKISGFCFYKQHDPSEKEMTEGFCERCGNCLVEEQDNLQWCVCERCGNPIISDGESQSFNSGCICENGNIVDYLRDEASLEKDELLGIISRSVAVSNATILLEEA